MPQPNRWGSRAHMPAGAENHARRFSKWLGIVAGAVVLLAGATGADAATCRGRNFVDSMNLVLGTNSPIRATSSDGQTYDRIENTSFKSVIGVALCDYGALDGVVIHLGSCTGHGRGCDDNPVMHLEFPSARDFHKRRDFFFAIPPGSDAGQRILAACNARVDEARGAGQDILAGLGVSIDVTLGVDTRRDTGALGPSPGVRTPFGVVHGVVDPAFHRPLGEYSKTAVFPSLLSVACAPLPQPIKAPPKVMEAALTVATSGNTCPKPATADVIIAAEAPRTVYYKIERGNGTTTTPDWIRGEIKMQNGLMGGKSAFLHVEHKLDPLDPGTRKFRLWVDGWGKTPWQTVEVECPPFKVTSARLKYDVENKLTCPKNVAETATFRATRPGKAPFEIKTQGGLVVHSGEAVFERDGMEYVARVGRPSLSMNAFDSDMMALIKNDPAANSGWVLLKVECLEVLSGTLDLRAFAPGRCEGEAALSIRTTMAGNVPYQLDCTSGRSWSRTVQSQQTGPNTYIGVDTVRFNVTNNEQVNCALKTRAPLPFKVLALDGHKYLCHRPTGVSGTRDFVPEVVPDPTGPRDPPRVVTDPPRGSGPGKVVDPPRISCAGGAVRNGQCFCPPRHKAVQAGNNAWRCVSVVNLDPPRKKLSAEARPKREPARRTAFAKGNRRAR